MLAVSSGGANDALNPTKYTLYGPGSNYIQSIVVATSDSIVATLVSPLVAGLWTITLSNINSADSVVITPNPTIVNFNAVDLVGQQTLSGGATNFSSEEILKNHASIFKGKTNFDALWGALAAGDDYIAGLSEAIFDQLFVSTASGEYLKDRASDDGLYLPKGIGLDEEVLRNLIIDIKADKLTLQSFLKVLNAFYKDKKTRAFVSSSNFEPFVMQDGLNLLLEIDGKLIEIVFNQDDFTYLSSVTALEICNILNSNFAKSSLEAFAVPTAIGTNTGVDIYSGCLGLKGNIKVLGGTAQAVLNFPEKLLTTQAVGTTWIVSKQTEPGRVRFTHSSGTNPSIYLLGNDPCYTLVLGSVFNLANKGSFEIIKNGVDGSGNSFFEIMNFSAVNQTVTQTAIADIAFYYAKPNTINDVDLPAFASQFSNSVDIQMPATIDIERNLQSGGYLGSDPSYQRTYTSNQSELSISTVSRTGSTLTITTSGNHGLSTNDKVLLSPSAPITTIGQSLEEQELTVTVTGLNTFTATDSKFLFPLNFSPVSISTKLYKNYKNTDGNVVLNINSAANLAVNDKIIVEDLQIKKSQTNTLFTKYLYPDQISAFSWTLSPPPAVLVDNYIYFVNSYGAVTESNFFRINVLTDQITQLSSVPTAQPLSSCLIKIGGVDKLFIKEIGTGTTVGFVYDISQDKWSKTSTLAFELGDTYVGLPNGKVFVYNNGAISPFRDFYIFDIYTGVWTKGPTHPDSAFLNRVSNGGMACSDEGQVFFCYGTDTTGPSANFRAVIYDSNENAIIPAPTSPFTTYEMRDPSVVWNKYWRKFVISGGDAYIAGFINPTIQTYDPQTKTWEILSSDGPLLQQHNSIVLDPHRMAFIGGREVGYAAVGDIIIFTKSGLGRDQNKTETFSIGTYGAIRGFFANDYFYRIRDDANGSGGGGLWFEKHKLNSKSSNRANFQKDYSIQSISGKSFLCAPLYGNKEKSLTPIATAPTVSLFKDSSNIKKAGSYIIDTQKFERSKQSFVLNQNIESNTAYSQLSFVSLPSNLPSSGYIVINYGLDSETSPIRYTAKSGSILNIESSYIFKTAIDSGAKTVYVSGQNISSVPQPFYLTNPSFVRIFAENLIDSIKASGSNVNKNIIYPNDVGLGNSEKTGETQVSDSIYIWGI